MKVSIMNGILRRALVSVFAGLLLAAAGLISAGDSSNAATKFTVFVGGGRAGISVESFRPGAILINVGDSVDFTNPYEEIHTVTFLAGGKAPDLIIPAGPPSGSAPPKLIFNPKAAFPAPAPGPASYDGSVYTNSGILNKGDTWNVSFSKQGVYHFICILHPGMEGDVHVLASGITVPAQQRLEAEIKQSLDKDVAKGEASAAAAKPGKTTNANGSTSWEIVNAASAGQADVMRFIPAKLSVSAGDTVVWKNPTFVPHTVTFADGAAVELVILEPQAGGPPNLVLNPKVLFPVLSSPNYDGKGYANSGFLGIGPEATAGSSFSLTFTKAGTYAYICVLHADQGMAGVIEVSAAGVRPPATGDAGLADSTGLNYAPITSIVLVSISVLGAIGISLKARRR